MIQMRAAIFYSISLLLLAGCTGGEVDALKKTNQELTEQNGQLNQAVKKMNATILELQEKVGGLEAELKKALETPQTYQAQVAELVRQEDLAQAQQLVSDFQKKFPEGGDAFLKAKGMVAKLEVTLVDRAQEKERLERLGFKAIKDKPKVTFQDVTLNAAEASIGNTFTSDSYDSTYHYQTAERDTKFITMRVSVSSESKDPKLVPMYIYKINGRSLSRAHVMDIQFRRWDSHATYIGLYHDDGNDFAKTKTVPFVYGVQIPISLTKEPFAVLAGPNECATRKSRRVGRPEVYYSPSSDCNLPPADISLDEISEGRSQMKLVRIINRAKL